MNLQKLYSYTRQAINDFQMIQDGDKIAIGISGGKDSLTLLYALSGLKKFIPQQFELIAVTCDLGFESINFDEIKSLCNSLDVEFHIVKTEIAQILSKKIKKGSFCSMCAKLRKGALNNFAKENACNKVAYAHHQDDFIETMMLSLLYEGQFFSFAPIVYFKEANLSVIRPLIYVPEIDIIGFKNKYSLPTVKNPCPHDGITKRAYVKSLIRQIQKENPGAKKKMFNAILKGKIYEY